MGTAVNDPVADIVADVIATTRRGSLMYARNRFHAPWGAAFPAAHLANFHVITAGGSPDDDGAPPSDVVIEGDGPATVWICGGYRLADGVRHPLTSVLPDVVIITAAEARGTGLGAAVDLIAAEADGTDPGAPAVMASLVDLLLVYLLRTWFAEHHDDADWGRALFDPTVGTALSLFHTDPGQAWTLDTLARATRTPRATLTRRFAALTGQLPMAYLTAWP